MPFLGRIPLTMAIRTASDAGHAAGRRERRPRRAAFDAMAGQRADDWLEQEDAR